MSYCHLCPGFETNIALTFGGNWDIIGTNRNDINNWINNPDIGTFSIDPKRVPKTMWDFISTQTCVEPNVAVPTQLCSNDSDCNDGKSCSADTCDPGTSECTYAMIDNCCGNFVCEANESMCSDCGPFTLDTPSFSFYYSVEGIMFDVQAVRDIILLGLTVMLNSGTSIITIYSAPGTYTNKISSPGEWTQIFTGNFAVAGVNFIHVFVFVY